MNNNYMNCTATLLSDRISGNNHNTSPMIRVHLDMPGAPEETTIQLDKKTFVNGEFKRGEKIRIITAFNSGSESRGPFPAIIAGESFVDFFNDDKEKLISFRMADKILQANIVSRHSGAHYSKEEELTLKIDTKEVAKVFYSMTKDTFSEGQQRRIEALLDHYNRGENSKKLEMILGITPVYASREHNVDLQRLRNEIDSRFSDMDAPKNELIRHFASSMFAGNSGSVICIVGPAGTGKTDLVRTVGELLNKPFAYIPCSGITNSLDITGDRQVYNSADAGIIVTSFYDLGTSDCMILLDEFDKMPSTNTASDSKDGNPYYALLTLFSERKITDTFLGTEIMCPNTVFVCTCNSLDNVPSFIQNRFDAVIHTSKYTDSQLLKIANDHIIPKVCKELRVPAGHISFTDDAIVEITKFIDDFGARRMGQHIKNIIRQIIFEWVETDSICKRTVNAEMARAILGGIVDEDNVRVRFRQHMEEYEPDVIDKVILLEEQLDRTDLSNERRQFYQRQLEYFVNLRPDRSPFTFNSEVFMREANEKLYGLKREKEILASMFHELAVKNTMSNKRVLLVGSPGVGKTALIQAVAEASGMKYIRISLNGADASGYIKGYGGQYKNADAGIIIRETAKAGSRRVLIHLDELDKVANVEVQAALLSLLDDSGLFADDYLEGIPIDYRSAIFIATANDYNMPPALLSRFTVVSVGAYTRSQREEILRDYLIPNACDGYGGTVTVAEAAKTALLSYSESGGVRELKECVNRVIRETAYYKRYNETVEVAEEDVYQILGPAPMQRGNRPEGLCLPGMANGLAVAGNGAGMCFAVESRFADGNGIEITGLPSEVVKDSVKLAMSVLNTDYGIDFSERKLHIHFAEGAVRKDGPSAGVSILVSIYSAATCKAVTKSACYTGEIDLFGYVFAVGGIVEKVGAADEAGIETVYIPRQCYQRLTKEERAQISEFNVEVIPVSHINEIVQDLFSEGKSTETDSLRVDREMHSMREVIPF